jgi:hypothetical protein
MLHTEIIAVYSQIHTKHINTLWGQNVELLDIKPGGKYSNKWTLNGYDYIRTAVSIMRASALYKREKLGIRRRQIL